MNSPPSHPSVTPAGDADQRACDSAPAPVVNEPPPARAGAWLARAGKLALFAATLALFAHEFRHVDPAKVGRLLATAPGLWLAPLPFFIFMSFDTLAWRRILTRLGRQVPYRQLFAVRLSSEAVGLSLPSGGVLTEGVSLYLLQRRCRVPAGEAVASLAARRLYFGVCLGLTVGLYGLVGWRQVAAASLQVIHLPGLEWVAPIVAVAMVGGSLALAASWADGPVAERVRCLLAAIPVRRLRRWLEGSRETFSQVDRSIARVFAPPVSAVLLTGTLCFMIWLVEAGETYYFLTLLGAGLSFRQVLSFDTLLTIVRGLAFFVPAGLGIQDLGYLAFLRGFGVPHVVTVGAAFVFVKRSKEIFWILIGYLLLGWQIWRTPSAAAEAVRPAGGAWTTP